MTDGDMTYSGVGVDYDVMDRFKRAAQHGAGATGANTKHLGFQEVGISRGESVFLLDGPGFILAHVEEGLGTKNLVADAIRHQIAGSGYDHLAQCAVAMIVNDMSTMGATPLSVAMHLAVGASNWFDDEVRYQDLIRGWTDACNLAGCVWGGGETPTLKDIVVPGTSLLSGSAMGIINPKERLIRDNIQSGDAIILITSSGIHANGLTLARAIADKLLHGYMTELPGGRSYGETLLDPTHIYVPMVEDCLNHGIPIHYAVHITGHGWRKLMRATGSFSYIVERLPPPLPIFDFIVERGPVSDEEAYGNFNMGAGFAMYVPEARVEHALRVLAKSTSKQNCHAFVAGYIEESEQKQVVIRPKSLTYTADTLRVR